METDKDLESRLKRLLDKGRAYGASVLAQRHLRKEPDNAVCHTVVGVAYREMKRFDDARAALKKSLKKLKETDSISPALVYYALGKVELAETGDPDEWYSWTNKKVPKTLKKAREYLERSAELDPRPDCLRELVSCFWDVPEKRAEYGELYVSLYGPDEVICGVLRRVYEEWGMAGDARAMKRMAEVEHYKNLPKMYHTDFAREMTEKFCEIELRILGKLD